jgi:SecD/SecF fusion protein
VPDVDNPEEVFDLIGTPAILEFKTEKSDDAEAQLTGQNIVKVYANQQSSSSSGYLEWGVSIEFDAEGAQKFYEMTSEQVGNKIYIYSNGECISEPTVNSAIAGGKTFISGSMDEQGAQDFALQILSGTFSVKLSLLENTVVSATLGDKALLYGLIAGGIALLLIFAFMIWRYKMLGVIASVALCFYVILILFFLMAIPAVQLTLAGIAGIILSIGMAIDGNIVIFERIKEEYAQGKRIEPAISSGFKKAFSAIFDSNITTIAVSIVLAILGTGSIQGFAITLLIGVALSMFTSLVVTRGLIKLYYPLNPNKASKYGLKRGEGVDELAEIK